MPAVQLGLRRPALCVLPVMHLCRVPVAVRAVPMPMRAMSVRPVPMPSGMVAARVPVSQTEHGLSQQSERANQ